MSSANIIADACARIDAAFAKVTRGDGRTLEQADLYDSCDDCLAHHEAARARARDSSWKEVWDEDIKRWGGAVAFLDEAGYLYYLPAIMSWILRQSPIDFWQQPAPDALISSLGYISASRKRFRPCKYADAMTSEQEAAVAAFLQATVDLFECDDALALLDEYWGRFAPDRAG